MKSQRVSPALQVIALVAAIFVALPLLSIFVRVPWSDLGDMLSQKSTREALLISLQTSIIAAVISCFFGVPLAWLLARSESRGLSALRVVCITPMVLPPVVGGIALLTAFGRQGLSDSICTTGSTFHYRLLELQL